VLRVDDGGMARGGSSQGGKGRGAGTASWDAGHVGQEAAVCTVLRVLCRSIFINSIYYYSRRVQAVTSAAALASAFMAGCEKQMVVERDGLL
jgi:hypothetical protein